MKLNRRDIRKLIFEVLNEEPQQSAFDLRREVRDTIIDDHLIRYYQEIYPDKGISTADDIRVGVSMGTASPEGYITSRDWGEYDWNSKALQFAKGLGESDIPVMWFASKVDREGAAGPSMLGPNALNAIISSMNKGRMKNSGYILARTRTSNNDPYSEFHGQSDKSVTVLYLKKI